MAINPELLKQSFTLALACEPGLAHYFYELLFSRHPELQKLFMRNERTDQERRLVAVLGPALSRMNDTEFVEREFGQLGAKHAEYGVTPVMYDWLRDAMLDTLEHVLGPAWTPELGDAWREAYQRLADAMLRGAARAKGGAA